MLQVHPHKGLEALEAADRFQPVSGEVEFLDLSELRVNAKDGINHIIREIQEDEIVEGVES